MLFCGTAAGGGCLRVTECGVFRRALCPRVPFTQLSVDRLRHPPTASIGGAATDIVVRTLCADTATLSRPVGHDLVSA